MFDFCALLAVDDDSALSSLSYLGAKAYKSERTSQSVQVRAYKSARTSQSRHLAEGFPVLFHSFTVHSILREHGGVA